MNKKYNIIYADPPLDSIGNEIDGRDIRDVIK